jgi:hypothetical protein
MYRSDRYTEKKALYFSFPRRGPPVATLLLLVLPLRLRPAPE